MTSTRCDDARTAATGPIVLFRPETVSLLGSVDHVLDPANERMWTWLALILSVKNLPTIALPAASLSLVASVLRCCS